MKGLPSFIAAHFRYVRRVPVAFMLSFSVSLAFSIVMIFQIFLTFRIVNIPFTGLSLELFIFAFILDQLSFFIAVSLGVSNLGRFAKKILQGEIDLLLLRPVPIVFFMYASKIRVEHIVMLGIYIILFLALGLHIGFTPIVLLSFFIYSVIAGFLYIFIVSLFNAVGCIIRNLTNIQRISVSIDELLRNRPTEIFPKSIQLFFTFIIPQMFVTSFLFDLVRGKDVIFIWIGLLCMSTLFLFLNIFAWRYIFRNYESIG